jgi:hypothetical protein
MRRRGSVNGVAVAEQDRREEIHLLACGIMDDGFQAVALVTVIPA